ncbi:MAG: hypothetical protein QM756_42690 [Polyangiaceae bacterium]
MLGRNAVRWFWLCQSALAGCITHIDDESSSIGRVERDCVVPSPAGVESLGAPVSLEYPDHSLWVWEALRLAAGRSVSTPSAIVESVAAACSAGPTLTLDEQGEPVSLIALTPAEADQNAARVDGKWLALSPLGGFVYEGTGYLYYDHVLRGPGVFDATSLGSGLCILAPGAIQCERVGLSEQTVLFDSAGPVVNYGGLVFGEQALVYGCRPVAELQSVCTVAAAPLDRVAEQGAYQFHSSFGGWQSGLEGAASIVDELGPITVAPYDDEYLMTTLDLFEARVYVRRAQSPLGPFGRRIEAFDVLPSLTFFPGGGREHAALRTSAHALAFSYTTDHPDAPGLHLVSYRIFGNFGQ